MKIARPGMGFADTPWWVRAIDTAVQTTSNIATARWGQPAPGTIIETPDGRYVRQADGFPVAGGVAVGATTTGINPLLLLGGIGLIAVLAMKK